MFLHYCDMYSLFLPLPPSLSFSLLLLNSKWKLLLPPPHLLPLPHLHLHLLPLPPHPHNQFHLLVWLVGSLPVLTPRPSQARKGWSFRSVFLLSFPWCCILRMHTHTHTHTHTHLTGHPRDRHGWSDCIQGRSVSHTHSHSHTHTHTSHHHTWCILL